MHPPPARRSVVQEIVVVVLVRLHLVDEGVPVFAAALPLFPALAGPAWLVRLRLQPRLHSLR
jgi:ABC-type transport system involved in cytochrome c biogenesis permease subunit